MVTVVYGSANRDERQYGRPIGYEHQRLDDLPDLAAHCLRCELARLRGAVAEVDEAVLEAVFCEERSDPLERAGAPGRGRRCPRRASRGHGFASEAGTRSRTPMGSWSASRRLSMLSVHAASVRNSRRMSG